MSTGSFTVKAVTLDNMHYYERPPSRKRTTPALQNAASGQDDESLGTDAILAGSKTTASETIKHNRIGSKTVRNAEIKTAFASRAERERKGTAGTSVTTAIDDAHITDVLICNGSDLAVINTVATNDTSRSQLRLEIDLTADEDDNPHTYGELAPPSLSLCQEIRPPSEEAIDPSGRTLRRSATFTTNAPNLEVAPSNGDDCGTAMMERSDVIALYQEAPSLGNRDRGEPLVGGSTNRDEALAVSDQWQSPVRQTYEPTATTEVEMTGADEVCNAATDDIASGTAQDARIDLVTDCLAEKEMSPLDGVDMTRFDAAGRSSSSTSPSSHHAPLPTPSTYDTAMTESDEEEMPFVPHKRRRRLIRRRRRDCSTPVQDRQSQSPLLSTGAERFGCHEEDGAFIAAPWLPGNDCESLACAPIAVNRHLTECVLVRRELGGKACLSIEIPESVLGEFVAPVIGAKDAIRRQQSYYYPQRSNKGPKRVRRGGFSDEEDQRLKNLKEQKQPKLKWQEIARYFPDRSKGSLQVRYCTRLKAK